MQSEFLHAIRQMRQYFKSESGEQKILDGLRQENGLAKLFQIFFDFYEFSPAALVTLDRTGRILAANLTLETLTGVAREELIGRSFFLNVLGEDRDIFFLHLRKIFKRKKPATCELRLQNQLCSRSVWVRLDGIYDQDLRGRAACRATLIDIDLQKRTEADLARLAAIVHSSEDAIIRQDPAGVITDWNPAAEKIYGYTAAEAVGRPIGLVIPPEGRAEAGRLNERLRRGEEIQTFETVRRTKDGRDVHISLSMSAIRGPQGELTAVATIERDVTERINADYRLQEIHEQLDLATRSAAIGTWDANVPAGTARWNEQLYLLLGLAPRPGATEYVERFFSFIHPADRENSRRRVEAAINTTAEDFKDEFRIVRADGTIRWLASQGRIYRDAEGQPVRMAGVNYDITDVKESEAALKAAQQELVGNLAELTRVNHELSEYAYAVSHDLKTPLRAVRNYVTFLTEDLGGALEDESKRHLQGLKTAVGQAEKLISDLLAFSRIGRMPLETEPIDIPRLLREIRSSLRLSSDAEMITADSWPIIEADRTLLMQIFQNLISNAVKFNDLEKKRVEVGWRDGQQDRIEIFVRDNGIGIEPQYAEQIFRVFQRLHTQKAYEGTGIGLALVKKAAVHLGGKVRLESTPGEGSTFFVQIPKKCRGGGLSRKAHPPPTPSSPRRRL